ncbi:hypothetical protein FKM82_017152 [Ascaphus truei]
MTVALYYIAMVLASIIYMVLYGTGLHNPYLNIHPPFISAQKYVRDDYHSIPSSHFAYTKTYFDVLPSTVLIAGRLYGAL